MYEESGANPEVAEPEVQGEEEPEVTEPADIEELNQDNETEKGRENNAAFAEMRRAKEEAEAKAEESAAKYSALEAEILSLKEQGKSTNEQLKAVEESRVEAQLRAESEETGIPYEDLKEIYDEEQAKNAELEDLRKEKEEAEAERDRLNQEVVFNNDLQQLKQLDKSIEAIEDMGERFMKMRATGLLSVEEAYYACKAAEKAETKNPANMPGKAEQSLSEGKTFFTREEVEAMSREEVNKNMKAIDASMPKW